MAKKKPTHGGKRAGQGRPASDWTKLGIKLPPEVVAYLATVPPGKKSETIAEAVIASDGFAAWKQVTPQTPVASAD